LKRLDDSVEDLVKVVPVSGFPEWLPSVRLVEERFISLIREQFQLFGFTPIETPAVERLEVLTAKGGMQRQIYSLGRPAEGDSDTGLGLHFDLTVPLARYVVQHAEELVFPFRRYQIQKVWRGERAQRGRFREFYQCDIDVIGRGSLDLIHDAEIPCVINSAFSALKLPEFQVRISNRKVLGNLLSVRKVEDDQLVRVLRAIDKSHNAGKEKTLASFSEERVASELTPAIMALIECTSIAEARKIFAAAKAPTEGLDELQSVIENAMTLGMPESRLRPDFRIARGLDYYTGTIYETFVQNHEDWGSICSGGRYDDLASYFSKQNFPGVGISIGLSRLLDLLIQSEVVQAERGVPTQVLVTTQDRSNYLQEYLILAKQLRAEGIATEVFLEPRALREQFGYASSNGIKFAIIAGENEFAKNNLTVKDLSNRTQETIPRASLIDYFRNRPSG
jgi:histidyl-tRNA synthetase